MDSFAMFEDNYPSADNQVSGIVALLAAAEAIGMVKEDIDQGDKDIMFTFFQGVSSSKISFFNTFTLNNWTPCHIYTKI